MIYLTYTTSEFPVLKATVEPDCSAFVAHEVFAVHYPAHLVRIVVENEAIAEGIRSGALRVQETHEHVESIHGAPVGPFDCDCEGCNAERDAEVANEIACGC